MSRLIDADLLRDQWLYNGENEHIYDTNDFLDSIDEQPTAFDVDRVIEELEANWFLGGWSVEHKGKSGTYYTDEEGKVVELHDAIRIVERGGVDEYRNETGNHFSLGSIKDSTH